jgi:hypothetical protein
LGGPYNKKEYSLNINGTRISNPLFATSSNVDFWHEDGWVGHIIRKNTALTLMEQESLTHSLQQVQMWIFEIWGMTVTIKDIIHRLATDQTITDCEFMSLLAEIIKATEEVVEMKTETPYQCYASPNYN